MQPLVKIQKVKKKVSHTDTLSNGTTNNTGITHTNITFDKSQKLERIKELNKTWGGQGPPKGFFKKKDVKYEEHDNTMQEISMSFDYSDPKSYYEHIKKQRKTAFQQFVDSQEKSRNFKHARSKEEHSKYIKISAEQSEMKMAEHIKLSIKLRNGQIENARDLFKVDQKQMRELDIPSKIRKEANRCQSLVDKINSLKTEDDEKDENSIVLKQRLADLLDQSHKILKFRALKPIYSTRDHYISIKSQKSRN
jgi:hypothetical protein